MGLKAWSPMDLDATTFLPGRKTLISTDRPGLPARCETPVRVDVSTRLARRRVLPPASTTKSSKCAFRCSC